MRENAAFQDPGPCPDLAVTAAICEKYKRVGGHGRATSKTN